MRKHNLVLVAFCLLTQFTFGQGILSLQKAIEIALKNNYAITIATNESQIAKNNATIGNAGMLPEISLYGARNYTGSNTKQEYQNDSLLNRSGVNADNAAAGIALKWTLFDGLRMEGGPPYPVPLLINGSRFQTIFGKLKIIIKFYIIG